jgi:hypothetical protein
MTSAPSIPTRAKTATVAVLNPVPAKFPTVGNLTQMDFDWDIGHMRPWLFLSEISSALKCSPEHASNLIDDGSLDAVIDIKAPDATRPAYRVFRECFFRFLQRHAKPPATNLEQALQAYFKLLPTVLSSSQASAHLRCTDTHVLTLADQFTDISASASERRCLRIHKSQLLKFINVRRVQ